MKHFLALLLLGISSAQAGNVSSRQIQTNTMSGVSAFVNHVKNDGVENGTRFWTASGGTLTTTSTAGSGVLAGSWDSSAAAQTMCSDLKTIQGSDQNVSQEAGFMLQCASGTCTHKIQVLDGSSNVLFSQDMVSSSTYVPNYYSSGAGGTGTKKLCLTSVAANEPIVYFDDGYLGRARNVGSVAQATLVGTIKATGCSAVWSGTSSSYANFSTQTGCSYAVTGAVEAPTTNVPAVRLRNQPPGKYHFIYSGFVRARAASDCQYRFSDGTNTSIEENYLEGDGTEAKAESVIDGSIDITSAISDSTFNIQQKKVSTGTCDIYGTTAYPGVIKVYRFPSSAEIAYRPELLANSWSGKHGADCSLASGTGSSITDWGGDATCTFTELINNNFGTVTSFTNGGNNSAGIIFTPKKTQRFKVCADFVLSQGGSTANQVYQLADGSNNEIASSASTAITGGNYEQKNVCGIFYASSVASQTVKLRINPNGQSANIGAPTGGSAVNWTIFALDQSLPAPVLVGSVTSQSTGAERIERARIANSGTCTTTTQSGSWVGSLSHPGTGQCTITYATNLFSGTPSCTCTVENAGYGCAIDSISSSAVTYRATVTSTGANSDQPVNIICMGPKGSL